MTASAWINALGFQLAWWACVLGAARGWPWVGVAATGVLVAIHLGGAGRPGLEARVLAVAVAAGSAFDAALMHGGRIHFEAVTLPGWPPVWMLALWLAFATTLNRSLRWLRDRTALAAAFGGIGGALSYLAGERLGAATLGGGPGTLALIGLGWALLTPGLCAVARRWDGVGPRDAMAPSK